MVLGDVVEGSQKRKSRHSYSKKEKKEVRVEDTLDPITVPPEL